METNIEASQISGALTRAEVRATPQQYVLRPRQQEDQLERASLPRVNRQGGQPEPFLRQLED